VVKEKILHFSGYPMNSGTFEFPEMYVKEKDLPNDALSLLVVIYLSHIMFPSDYYLIR